MVRAKISIGSERAYNLAEEVIVPGSSGIYAGRPKKMIESGGILFCGRETALGSEIGSIIFEQRLL